jgi:hypothetical protein
MWKSLVADTILWRNNMVLQSYEALHYLLKIYNAQLCQNITHDVIVLQFALNGIEKNREHKPCI